MKTSREGLSSMNIAVLFLAIVPGLLAGLLAFVITYD